MSELNVDTVLVSPSNVGAPEQKSETRVVGSWLAGRELASFEAKVSQRTLPTHCPSIFPDTCRISRGVADHLLVVGATSPNESVCTGDQAKPICDAGSTVLGVR